MCSIATRQLIENSIQGFIGKRNPFTAFDVTKDIRSKGGSHERHNELKKEVHQIFDDGQMQDYNRSLVRLPSAPGPAFLYHPPEVDPNSYVAGTATPQTVVQAQPSATSGCSGAQANQVVTTVDDDDDDGALSQQGKGFIRIPVSLVRAIGLKGGDQANIRVAGNSQVEVSKPIGIVGKLQMVDPRGNVRIYGSTLRDAGIFGNAKAELSVSSDTIIITSA